MDGIDVKGVLLGEVTMGVVWTPLAGILVRVGRATVTFGLQQQASGVMHAGGTPERK